MKKNLKQILAIVIAINMLVPCVFAAPVAVTATDSVTETVMEENLSEVEEETAFSLEFLNDSECKYVKDVISLDASELYGVVAYKNDVETYTIALYNDRPGDDYVDRFLELFMNLPVYSENEPEEDREVLEITVSNNTDYARKVIYSYTDGIMADGESTGYFIKSADIMAVFESMGESWGDDLYWPTDPEIEDFCIYMQKIDGMGYLLSIDGILYGFEEKDGITAGIGRFAEPSSEMSEKMSSFVSENEKVIYFEIRAFDTETEAAVEYTEKVAMEAEVFMPAGSGFSAAMGKDYRVYSISETAEEISVTESSLYEFSFELDTFGTYAVVYNPNAITLNFYDGENIYHTILNLATTDTVTLPENPQNKTVDGVEYEFCGWYSREDGQGLRLYDGVTLANIGSSSVFAYWQPADEPYIESLELWDHPEGDDNIAGTLYGYRETDEMTVKLMRFSDTSETAASLSSGLTSYVEDGCKVMFFALVEYDKVNDVPYGFADGKTLGVTIKLASEELFGINYKVYNMNSADGPVSLSVANSDLFGFTFLTEGLGVFAVVYDPRLVSVGFYNDGELYYTAKLTLSDTISYPEAPTKDGYTFEGWYTEADGKGKKLEETMTYLELGSENVYAYWTENEDTEPDTDEPDIEVTTYTISSVSDFNNYASLIKEDNETYGGAKYVLSDDIDVIGAILTPFGTEEAPFSGTFDGNGKKISNVTYDDVKYVGIIGYMNGGTVKNLWVKYDDIESITYLNCTRFGGVVGVIDTANKSNVVIENCKTSGNVKISTTGFMRYGGIFSDLRSAAGNVKIADCVTFCNADIEAGKTAYAGAFGGYANSTTNTRVYDYIIENCISYGNVSLTSSAITSYAAGFVGYSHRNDPDDTGVDSGGIFAEASLFSDESNYTNCVSFGNSSATSAKTVYYGPFVGGINQFVNFNNCYVSSSQTSTGTILCEADVTAKAPEEMNTAEFLSGTLMLDTENVWCINRMGRADLRMFEEPPITITLGDNLPEGHTRYIEVNGIQTEMESRTYIVPEGEGNLLIEIIEKDADGAVVDAGYYFVDRSLRMVDKILYSPFMSASEKTSIRTKSPMGIRFKAQIRTSAKYEETDFVIDEYGFVVTRKDILGDDELTLDTEVKVTGVAYNKQQNIDIVFDADDNYHTFTGFVKNIPVKHYRTDLVCKTYTKISVGTEQFVIYGEPTVGSVYDTAKKILAQDPGNEDLIKIVLDYENEMGIPGDELYPEEPEESDSYKIISNYEINIDEDGNWRFYYEIYDPCNGTKLAGVPSVKSAAKVKELGDALEVGTIVESDGTSIDDTAVVGTVSEENLNWLTTDESGSLVAVSVLDGLKCNDCITQEVVGYNGNYRDIFGVKFTNTLKVTDETVVACIKNTELSSMFKYGIIELSSIDELKKASKYIRCYNKNALDKNGFLVTKYASFVKAYICNDQDGNVLFILAVVHDNDNAALYEACSNHTQEA